MIFNTENYNAQELQLLFEELQKLEFLRTKKQYSTISPGYRKNISRRGVDKRIKSIYGPQCYIICGITLISDKPPIGEKFDYYNINTINDDDEKLKLIKIKDKYF